jgi:tetratricopeptide (TPR) repeat protein
MTRVAQLLEFHSSDPTNVPLTIDVLDAQLSAGTYEDALAFADRLDPSLRIDAAVRLRVARCAMSISRLDVAIDDLSALIEAGDASAAVLHDFAFALFAAGRLADAESALAPVVTLSADIAEIGILHARILYHRGDLKAAALVIGVVTDAHPGRADAWGLAALVHLDGSAPDRAAHAADAALAIKPDEPLALMARGALALADGDAPQALACFGPVATREPANGRAHGGLGEAQLLAGDVEGARASLVTSSSLQPEHLGTWHALAWSQLLLADIDAADISFRAALDTDRNFAESHGGLAIVYALQGKRDLAEQALRRARRLDADCGNAAYAESLLLSADGRDAEADIVIHEALGSRVRGLALPAGNTVARLRALMTSSGPG